MNITKTLIPNKEWLITDNQTKLGSISKSKKGYNLNIKGKSIKFKNLAEIKNTLNIKELEESRKTTSAIQDNVIYDYPCNTKPFHSLYNIKLKLPLFSKSAKSKCQYCARHYVIKFRKGWVKSFCPKLINLGRYPFFGPYKTEKEMKDQLNKLNKNEET